MSHAWPPNFNAVLALQRAGAASAVNLATFPGSGNRRQVKAAPRRVKPELLSPELVSTTAPPTERFNGQLTSDGELAQLQLTLAWELPQWFRALVCELPLLGSRLQVPCNGTTRSVIVLPALQIRDEVLLFEPGRALSSAGCIVLAVCGRRSRSLVVLHMVGPDAGKITWTTPGVPDADTLPAAHATIQDWVAMAVPSLLQSKPRQRFPAAPKPRVSAARNPRVLLAPCERSLGLFSTL